MEQEGQSRLMNLVHAIASIGAISGPAAVGFLLSSGTPLVSIFIGAAVLFALLAASVAFTRFPTRAQQAPKDRQSQFLLLRHPLLLLLTAAFLIYAGTEIGVSSWSSEYIVKVFGASTSTGAFSASVFWLGVLLGRLGISLVYKGSRQEILMFALALLSTAALAEVLLVRSTAVALVALFVVGLGCSGFYPLGMSVVGRHFKSGVAVGTAATGGAAGSIVFPLVMAFISQTIGIRHGFWFYLGINLLLVTIAALLVQHLRRERNSVS
jgi:fucose permease